MEYCRPNPILWLYYQYSGRLPSRYNGWVLRDSTTKTWLFRAGIRGLLRISPLLAGMLIVFRVALGGPWPACLGAVGLGLLVGMRYAFGNLEESVDARLVRHGFPRGCGTRIRKESQRQRDAESQRRYEAVWRAPLP
jgi:hypothetical protein